MKDKNLAFSAMLLSVAFFALIGFMTYYPMLQARQLDSHLTAIVYGYLSRFGSLRHPLKSRGLLLMCILGAVLLYNPRKKEVGRWRADCFILVWGVFCFWSPEL